MKNNHANANALILRGAWIALTGFVLSGPASFILVKVVRPQPAWTSVSVFVANYHIIQDIPFYFGFLLVAGMLMVAAGHYTHGATAHARHNKFLLLLGVVWAIVFAGLISFNYICQTTFVRNLVLHYDPVYDPIIGAFSMSNPLSLCWSVEMWGYAFLGVSTWFGSVYYKNRNRTIEALMVVNGVVSMASAMWTVIDSSWTMTKVGLMGYFLWNVLMIAMMILIGIQSPMTTVTGDKDQDRR